MTWWIVLAIVAGVLVVSVLASMVLGRWIRRANAPHSAAVPETDTGAGVPAPRDESTDDDSAPPRSA